jgi:hypothetical protein
MRRAYDISLLALTEDDEKCATKEEKYKSIPINVLPKTERL